MRVTQLLLVSTKSVKVGHLYDHCEDVQSKVYNSKPKSTIMCTENSGSGMCCAEYRILPLCSALTARVFLRADHLGALIVTLHLHAKTVI